MGMSPYMASLRKAVGTRLLVIPAVTGIVRDEQNRILLVHQLDTRVWSTPGGAIDPGETPADAVVRELWEETGFFVAPTRILGVYSGPETHTTYPGGDEVMYVNVVFECEIRGGSLREETDETSDAAFIGMTELSRYPLTNWAAVVLPRLFSAGSVADFVSPSWTPPAP